MAENPVGNKRSNTKHDDATLKPLRKIRAVSGYNLWHAEFMKTTGTYHILCNFHHLVFCLSSFAEAKLLTTFAKKNLESAKRWNLLSEEDKELYREKAAYTEFDKKPLNLKQQTTKILNHLQELVSECIIMCIDQSIISYK